MTEHETRRRFVGATGGLVVAALAGCIGNGDDEGSEDGMDDGSGSDGNIDDGVEYPAVDATIQVTLPPQ